MKGFAGYATALTKKKLVFIAIGFLAAGCGPTPIRMVNPQTGDEVRCAAVGNGKQSIHELQIAIERCARQFEAVGYIRFRNLTQEQKASLEKNTPSR